MRVTSRPTPPTTSAITAARLLGGDHPLARASERCSSVRRQLAGVGLVLFGAIAAQLGGLPGARSLMTAAALVEGTLACSLLLGARDERRLARELIAAGRDSVPLPVLEWERRRLIDRAYRHRLARSLDRTREAAQRPSWLLRGSRPLFRLDVVAAASPELVELATALRQEPCEPAGVAMTERLLCEGDSPLYGDDIVLLRETLRQIRSRLEA